MNYRKFLIAAVLCMGFVLPMSAQAHAILPKGLETYLKTHPNASQAEITAFIDTNDLYQGKEQDKQRLLRAVDTADPGTLHTLGDFFVLGIFHILEGIDHLLFLLSILLVFRSIRELVKLVSTFTTAHSLTLILTGTNILSVNSRIVEPLIAFSIAYVAATSVFFTHRDQKKNLHTKTAIIFLFGLFHGLGFADVLRGLAIPQPILIPTLITFNLGIEAGQLMVLAVLVPLLLMLKKFPWYSRAVWVVAAILVALGLMWGIARIAGVGF